MCIIPLEALVQYIPRLYDRLCRSLALFPCHRPGSILPSHTRLLLNQCFFPHARCLCRPHVRGQAKCLAVQGTQIEDLLVAAEERLAARDDAQRMSKASSPSTEPSAEVSPRRARLVFSRQSKPAGWWLWDLLSGGGGGKARRRRATPKVVLHQIAAETPSLASMPSGVLALEIIRRTLGIELPSLNNGQKAAGRRRARGAVAAKVEAAPLTWELLEAAFQPVSEEGAGQEAVGFMTRLDLGSMHGHALQILKRIRALEGRGVEAGIRVPADVLMLAAAVKSTEARRAMVITEAKER